MPTKKAQVTGAAILGILLVLIISITLYLQRDNAKEEITQQLTLPPFAQQVATYIQSCIKETVPTGLYLIGKQSGYYIPPSNTIKTNEATIALYNNKGTTAIPTIQDIEKEMNLFMEENLPLCTDFSTFPSLTITQTKPTVTTTIRQDDILLKITYPITIEKATQSITLTTPFTTVFPIRLQSIHATASEIVAMTKKDPEDIDLLMLLDTDMDIAIIPHDSTTIIYSITDKKSQLNNIPYTFLFAHAR